MADSNGRQFVKYDFYSVDPLWRRLPPEEQELDRREFCAVVDEQAAELATVVLRAAEVLLERAREPRVEREPVLVHDDAGHSIASLSYVP